MAKLSNPLFFYTSDGGLLRPSYRYVVYRDGRLQEIHTLAELQTLYAPITTANEALSYAIVVTGLDADFRQTLDDDLHYQFYGLTLAILWADTGKQLKQTDQGWLSGAALSHFMALRDGHDDRRTCDRHARWHATPQHPPTGLQASATGVQ